MSEYKRATQVANMAYTNKTEPGFKKNKALSDRRSKVYEDDTGNVWIGYRGTNPKNANDLIADGFIAMGLQGFSPRFRGANEKLNQVKKFYGKDAKINLSAHSLGGSQVKYVNSRNSGINSSYTFSAGANPRYELSDSLMDNLNFSKKKKNAPLYEYSTGVDPISTGIYIPRKNTTKTIVPRKKGLDPHSMANFLD